MARAQIAWGQAKTHRPVNLFRYVPLCTLPFLAGVLVALSPFQILNLSPNVSQSAEPRESIPSFRRLLLSAEQLPEEMNRVRDGVLVRLPRAEFEALVDRATQATAKKVPPLLLEAHYHAKLKDDALFGEGQWKLTHKGPGPGLLSLDPFNLAVRQARFENDDAILAAFDGKTPALLVETPGERTVSLDWSARGEPGPNGLQFHLEMPSSPVALMELDVPVGCGVTMLKDGALLSGPHEAEKAELRRWKIVCGGTPSIDVLILPIDRADAVSPPLVRQRTAQKLNPEGLEATFELTLDGPTRGVRELVCECDPELRLGEVVGPNVGDCSFQRGDEKKPSRLTIRLREPTRAGTWQIRCLAPLNRTSSPGGARQIAWHSPGLRLLNGASRGETLTLWLHPELRVEDWDSGHYRLISSEIERASGGQILTLQGGGLGPLRRPSCRARVNGVDYRVQQLTWLHGDASGMGMTVQLAWDVDQGQLFQLPIRLPPQWKVDKVELNPATLLRDWRVRGPADKATLVVDLAEPIGVRKSTEGERETEPARASAAPRSRPPMLTLHLKHEVPNGSVGKWLPFPDVAAQGARFREGALALDCDERLFHLEVEARAERSEVDGEGPWGQRLPEYYYRFKGQLPPGRLRVLPRAPRIRARCETEVLLASARADVELRLLFELESGTSNTVELSLSSGDGEPWSWRNEAAPRGEESSHNRVVRMDRLYGEEISSALHLIGQVSPPSIAAVAAAWPSDERWRLTLARPLRLREPLRLHARRSLQPLDGRWHVPLPIVRGTERMEGEVRLHLERSDLVHPHSQGLREAAALPGSGTPPWRTYRYGQSAVGLALTGAAQVSSRASTAVIDRAVLLTHAGGDGGLHHRFSFQVANWNEPILPLRLPPGSRPAAVRIDGRWLPRLLPKLEEDAVAPADDPIELNLPVPIREGKAVKNIHRIEVVYTRAMKPWTGWQQLEAPAPSLPVGPLSFRRIWRLAPQLTPLHSERYQRVPATGGTAEWPLLPRRFADLFHLPGAWRTFDPMVEDRAASTREILDRAGRELRVRRAEKTISMREMVDELAFDHLKDRSILLLDAVALREAGIGPETTVRIDRLSADDVSPPWTVLGLVAVPVRSAILLTTSGASREMLRYPLLEEMEKTLADAAARGQDPSGRFCSALNWLDPDGAALDIEWSPPDSETQRADWSEWEPIAGVFEDGPLVVRREGVTAAALVLVFAVGVFFWLRGLWPARPRLLPLLSLLALLGLCVVWLPGALRGAVWWALLAACAGAVAHYLRCVVVLRIRRRAQSTLLRPRRAGSAAAVGLLLSAGLIGWSGRADAPTPFTVYLVPTGDEKSDKQMVLAPADLLDRLKDLTRMSGSAAVGLRAVLLDASYEGQVVEGQAEFAAVFSAYSTTDAATRLTLPWSDVQLIGDVLLDGARAWPSTLPAPQGGCSLKLQGRGRHKIELRFRAPILGTREDRNVMFAVPPLPHSRLSWRLPPGALEPQMLVKYGAQWKTRAADGERMEADLGAVPRPVHLHWYQPSGTPLVTYRAAYLWELGVESNRLTAWLRYRVRQGSVNTLEVDLPEDLEVSSATAQRTASVEPAPWSARVALRDWRVGRADGQHRLYLEFPYPVQGDFQVTLKLLPREPLPARASLPIPSPRGVRASGASDLAYRTDAGLSAQRDTSNYLTRIASEQFAADWPDATRLEENFSGTAYRITPDHVPQLVLRLVQTPPAIQSEVDVTVQAGGHSAQFRALADLKSANKDLAYLEWELPTAECTIVSATGDDVRAWKQHGARLLVWLNRTTTATRLQLSGWLPFKPSGATSHLEWSGPRLHSASRQHTRLHVTAVGDQILSEVVARNLQPIAVPGGVRRTGEREASFESSDLLYHLRCRVRPASNAVAQVLTLAEANEREFRFTTAVHYRVTRGELQRIHLRLRNWDREKVELRAEGIAETPSPRRMAGERSWLLTLPAGITGVFRATLSGVMPLEDAELGIHMPEVVVGGVESVQSFVAVTGDLSAQASGTLQALSPSNKELASSWPGETQRLERAAGQAWRVTGSEWHVRLLPRARTEDATPSLVFLTEQGAVALDGRRWLHEGYWWLRHEAYADLNLDFPAPARVLAASVDGVEVTTLQSAPARAWLPMPGRSGVRCLRLRWIYDPSEPLDRPNLIPPRVADAVQGPTLWSVRVPAGWDAGSAAPAARLGSGAPCKAALSLYRADAQLRIAQALAKQARAPDSETVASVRRRFELYCLQAQNAFAQGGRNENLKGPSGQSPIEWMADLQAAGRALGKDERVKKGEAEKGTKKNEDTKSSGEREKETNDRRFSLLIPDSSSPPLSESIPESGGIVVSWYGRPGSEPPRLRLTSQVNRYKRQALAASGEWIGGLVVVWILSLMPFVRARLPLFWPEQIALLGLLGLHLAGTTSIVLGLFVLAIGGRLFLMARGVHGWLRGPRHQPSTMNAVGSGGG